jgi:hypothetical protein
MHDNKQSASLEQLSRSVLDMEPSEPPDVEIDPPVPITPPVAMVPPLPVAPPLCKRGLEEQAKTKRMGRGNRFIACPFPGNGFEACLGYDNATCLDTREIPIAHVAEACGRELRAAVGMANQAGRPATKTPIGWPQFSV